MPATYATVWGALAETYADDTSSGGIVPLTGKAEPFVRWGDDGMNDRPILVGSIAASRVPGGAPDAFMFTLDVNVFVDAGSTGLADAIAARIEAVTTQPNLNSTGHASRVDVAPYLRGIDPLPELDEGRQRLVVRYDCRWNR